MSLSLDVDFDSVYQKLDRLERMHHLQYRIEVGRVILHDLFDGDFARFRDQNASKGTSFTRFLREYEQPLNDMGLSGATLRRCVLAYEVIKHLTPDQVGRLMFTQYVDLAAVSDPVTRGHLIDMAIEAPWTRKELASAIQDVLAGRWPDSDPATDGIQPRELAELPQPAPAPERPVAPGRVVRQAAAITKSVDDLLERWSRVPPERWTAADKAQVRSAVVEAEARLKELKRKLR